MVSYFTYVPEIASEILTANSDVLLLPILNYSLSATETKSTFNLKANLKLTTSVVVDGAVLYAQFPAFDFKRVMFHDFNPACGFTRMGDNQSTPFLFNCSYAGERIVKFILKLDPDNEY